MIRAARKILHLAAVVSLLLNLTICFVWLRSALLHSWEFNHMCILWSRNSYGGIAKEYSLLIESDDGVFICCANEVLGKTRFGADELTARYRFFHHSTTPENERNHIMRWKSDVYRDQLWFPGVTITGFQFQVPDWVAALATGALPLLVVIDRCAVKYRKLRAISLNLCVDCGYDLRASGDRCPECGTVRIPKAKPIV
jgi:hypothetical protein